MRRLGSHASTVVLLAALLLAGRDAARADDGDESLVRLLNASDVVVDATLASLEGPRNYELGVAHYAAELEVHACIKGSLPLPPPEARAPARPVLPRATIVRFELEEADRLPYLKQGARVVLFLKGRAEGAFPAHETADIWFGVQPYGPWLVRRLTTLAPARPASPPAFTEPVALSLSEAAFAFVSSRLEEAGILCLVGAALDDASLEVRVAATWGILSWWRREVVLAGGLESAMEAAATWWKARSVEGLPPK